MAATVASKVVLSGQGGPAKTNVLKVSSMTSGQLVAITHGETHRPFDVSVVTTTPPTAPGGVAWSWESTDESADTITLRFRHSDGASALTGAVVEVRAHYYSVSEGGLVTA